MDPAQFRVALPAADPPDNMNRQTGSRRGRFGGPARSWTDISCSHSIPTNASGPAMSAPTCFRVWSSRWP
ncbi:MAG TPA: hypothetical protein EYO87_09810 [Paracoccus sp.]|nr:hypothetical protein [Paracoccus sp. (in: a-proteobacteria)]